MTDVDGLPPGAVCVVPRCRELAVMVLAQPYITDTMPLCQRHAERAQALIARLAKDKGVT